MTLPQDNQGQIRRMGLEEFVRRLHEDEDTHKKCYALFLGAGCSVSSGISAARELVTNRWLPRLRNLRAPDRSDLETWASEEIQGYDPKNPALSYGDVFDALFPNPVERQQEIEEICDGRTPSFGYAVLAQLMTQPAGRFNVVLTTNFDDLVADALYLYTEVRPLVISHESLAPFIRSTRTRPLVVKLHGDHRLSPRNTVLETETLEAKIQHRTVELLRDRGIIFMGYGGNDSSILKLLNNLPDEALPFGAFWVHPREPSGQVRDWLLARRGFWVRSKSFDMDMLLIHKEFKLPHPDEKRLIRIFEDYQRKFQELSRSIPPDAQVFKEAASDAEARFSGPWKVISEADQLERQDPNHANEVYQQGVEQFQDNAPLLNQYAIFLTVVRKNYDIAERIFRQALKADPKHANSLGNYANFLCDVKKDYDAAEALYKRALEADPKHAGILSNYAIFLKKVRKDYDAAEALYKRGLEADPKHANSLGSYANFLCDVRKDYDAAEAMYRWALEVDPKHANNLGSYANFLCDVRKDYDAAEAMYKRALEADLKHVNSLGSYANFLCDVRKDYDAAEAMYKRALEADPKHANNLGSYANFLYDVRKDNDAAEAMYKRALEVDPKHANNLGNYARLLLASGRSPEGLAILDRADQLPRETRQPPLELECAFYRFAHGPLSHQKDALRNIRTLVEQGARSPGWDLSRNVSRAILDGHSEKPWLPKLASVVNDDAQPDVLSDWPAWQDAAT